jgi:hypothetical protein
LNDVFDIAKTCHVENEIGVCYAVMQELARPMQLKSTLWTMPDVDSELKLIWVIRRKFYSLKSIKSSVLTVVGTIHGMFLRHYRKIKSVWQIDYC